MNEPFYKLPQWLLRTTEISLEAKVLLVRLSHFDDDASRFIDTKIASLADDLALSARTIRRAMAELKEAGLIQSKHGRRSDSYQIMPRLDWPKVIGLISSDWPKVAGLNSFRLAKNDTDRDKIGQSKPSASLLVRRDREIAAPRARARNGTPAAAFPDPAFSELPSAIAEVTGEVPDAPLMTRIVDLIEEAGGDAASAIAFVQSKHKRRFKSNGIWPTVFAEDFPAFLEQHQPVKAEPQREPEPELTEADLAAKAEHAETMARIHVISKRIPK